MNDLRLRVIASTGLVLGGILGMAGTFATSAPLRGLAWGIDGVGIAVGELCQTSTGTDQCSVKHLRDWQHRARTGTAAQIHCQRISSCAERAAVRPTYLDVEQLAGGDPRKVNR